MKVPVHSSLEPPTEYNKDQTPLTNHVSYDIFNQFRSYSDICSFWLVLKGKTCKEIPKSSRLKFPEMFLANNFALSEAE